MSDLHERLLAAVNERLELANAADPGPWRLGVERNSGRVYVAERMAVIDWVGTVFAAQRSNQTRAHENAAFIAANDPASVIRHCKRDLKVLERHRPEPVIVGWDRKTVGHNCAVCYVPGEDYDDYGRPVEYPCPDVVDLATAYAIDSALAAPQRLERGGSPPTPPR